MTRAAYRPAEHYIHGGNVIVPERVAAWLLRYTNLDRARTTMRGADPEVDAVLMALRYGGIHWRDSVTGSVKAPEPEVAAPCQWMSTTQAADLLQITSRAVRLAITGQRLKADQIDGRWRIAREDVEHYRAARAA